MLILYIILSSVNIMLCCTSIIDVKLEKRVNLVKKTKNIV